MFERLQLSFHDKKKIIFIAAVAVLLLIMATSFMIKNTSKRASERVSKKTDNTKTNNSSSEAKPKGSFPNVKVVQWTHTDSPLSAARPYVSYTFKTAYSPTEANAFAARFGFGDSPQKKDSSNFYSRTDAFLLFNTTNGSYVFYDKNGLSLGNSSLPAIQNVKPYIERMGVNDATLGTVNTYRKKSQSGIVYFEIHRDWASVGGPILNQLGLLNLPETSSLSSINQSTFKSAAKDEDIYGTNDGSDGYKRADEFNTMTIGIEEATQKVVTMRSNIRPFLSQTAPQPLISYAQATQLLAAGKATSIYTAPAGQGVVDWEKVYPSDTVQIQNAEVTESVIAYLEELPAQTQNSLTPYYLFKGFAQSPSGYRIQFIAAIDAVDHSVTPLSLFNRLVGQAWAQQPNSSGLKLGTFSFITPSVTPAPTNGITPPTIPDSSSECVPLESELQNISDWSGLSVGYYEGRLPLTPMSQPAGYYIVSGGGAGLNEDALIRWIDSVLERGTSQQLRDIQDIMRDILTISDCPIRLTGASPTLFAYSDVPRTYSIFPKTHITYADPALTQRIWEVHVDNDELMVQGIDRPYLYYEYQKIDFDRPTKGWVVDKHDLPQFAYIVGTKLGLRDVEQERLVFELNHAATAIDSGTLFVGLIPDGELTQKLPLSVEPDTTSIHRIHFYVGSAHTDNHDEPILKPIQREKNMILELGASSEERTN